MMLESKALTGRKVAVITVSDRSVTGLRPDLSGPTLVRLLKEAGAEVVFTRIVPDDRGAIEAALREAAFQSNLVVTTGGTGLAQRDVTPEATLAVCNRLVPGLAELIRSEGAKQTRFAALSRGICGIAGKALVINLPGSPAGAEHGFRTVFPLLPHALDLLAGHTEHGTTQTDGA